jgi:hypothetical protein
MHIVFAFYNNHSNIIFYFNTYIFFFVVQTTIQNVVKNLKVLYLVFLQKNNLTAICVQLAENQFSALFAGTIGYRLDDFKTKPTYNRNVVKINF